MNTLSLQLQQFLQPRLPDYLELLRQMVAINSYTRNPAGVNALGELTAAAFADLGFTAETIQSDQPGFGQHLILTRRGRTPRTIGLVSHLDTVFPPEEEWRNNFSWRPEGDRIYGPGTVDIKGGTVMIKMVLDSLRAVAPDLFEAMTWVILLDAAEEDEAHDFGAICRQRLSEDGLACLIFEGGERDDGDNHLLVVARKGMAIYEVETTGRAAHAGTAHQEGANALVQMASVIQQIASFTDYERHLTFNVGVISGGTVTNRVPHYARVGLEMRAFTTDVYDDGVAKMMALNGYSSVSSPQDGYPCQTKVELTRQTAPWPRNLETDRLYDIWQETAVNLGLSAAMQERGGLSDGNHSWFAVPTLDGLGPSGGNAHCSERSDDGRKDQEYVLVSSFMPKTIWNVLSIVRLVEQS
jgi:glutamate carboxypeptidase